MTDIFPKEKRSGIMSRVKGVNTGPELTVRSLIHRMGFRFRLHRRDLPGAPDIVLPRLKKVVLVHGCFWHGHRRCRRSGRPQTNIAFWETKLDRNIIRDKRNLRDFRKLGWNVLVIWQCQIGNPAILEKTIHAFLHD